MKMGVDSGQVGRSSQGWQVWTDNHSVSQSHLDTWKPANLTGHRSIWKLESGGHFQKCAAGDWVNHVS